MDSVQIEIKDEFIHQDKELQIKKKSIATSSIENTNISHEQVHIKNEPIDHGSTLLLTENTNFTNSSMIKKEVSEAENQETRKKGIETQKSTTDYAILDLNKPLSNLHDCIQGHTFLKCLDKRVQFFLFLGFLLEEAYREQALLVVNQI